MRMDRRTLKTEEALRNAGHSAEPSGQPEIRPIHLLDALVRQSEGIVAPVPQRPGADPRALATAIGVELASDRADRRGRSCRWLAELGWDPAIGARPLERAIQRPIQDPLALAVLDGRFRARDRVVVDVDPDGGLRLDRGGVAASAGAEVE